MPVITLTSDWNSADYYIAAIKGRLQSIGGIEAIDISHNIKSYNTAQAAFVIRNSFHYFPEGSVHLIFINSEPDEDKPFLVVYAKGHYFIGADNGIFSLILKGNADKIIKLPREEKEDEFSFPGLTTFTSAAIAIIQGKNIHELGPSLSGYQERVPIRPIIEENSITGSVVYIDSYYNAITNISKELFERITDKRKFEIFVQSKHYRINRISKHYHEEEAGELLAVFNTAGLLEIAINNGNAARLLNLDTNSSIRIEFSEKKEKKNE